MRSPLEEIEQGLRAGRKQQRILLVHIAMEEISVREG